MCTSLNTTMNVWLAITPSPQPAAAALPAARMIDLPPWKGGCVSSCQTLARERRMIDESTAVHRSSEQLNQGLDAIRSAPVDAGVVRLIVRRPAVDEREVVQEAVLDVDEGLLSDTWRARGSGSTADGAADQQAQVTVVNARAIETIAGEIDHWPIAGDQLYIDLDISEHNLPPGTRLSLGEAELEMSAKPHTGCAKFSARFGADALRFVASPEGRALRLRGANARVVRGGVVRVGDPVLKLD
jgi:hypothetical protein